MASLSSLRPVDPGDAVPDRLPLQDLHRTAIWHLIDAGALALDAPVRTYIPELRLMDETAAAEVTVANLLDHTAGW